jgi:hypothetical protein
MYTIQFHEYQITCQSADEVRALCNGTNGSVTIGTTNYALADYCQPAKPATRKYRRKKKIDARSFEVRKYAREHDMTAKEAAAALAKKR